MTILFDVQVMRFQISILLVRGHTLKTCPPSHGHAPCRQKSLLLFIALYIPTSFALIHVAQHYSVFAAVACRQVKSQARLTISFDRTYHSNDHG